MALRSVPAGAVFLRETAPTMLVPTTSLERAAARGFGPAAEAAARALDEYAAWLRDDLQPKARGTSSATSMKFAKSSAKLVPQL